MTPKPKVASLRGALFGVVLMAPPAALADFRVVPQEAPTAPAWPDPAEAPSASPAPATRRPTRPVPPTARGFGTDVPLSFAVRQIVPRWVRVDYGPGIDRDAPVSWTGGRPWGEALRAAVGPLGLRVVIGREAVAIVRA